MKKNLFVGLIFCFAIIFFSCHKESSVNQELTQDEVLSGPNNGATQISGVAFFATTTECVPEPGSAYAIRMTGDLVGCFYIYIDEFECSPSGTYREEGRDHFVGTYMGVPGSFWTTYKFESKYEDCDDNIGPLGAEIFGRCQHPLTQGSGTGAFLGATGRLDIKDDIAAGNYPYRGHLKF